MEQTEDDWIWDPLIEAIEKEECILIIGPDIAVAGSDKSVNQLIREFLDQGNTNPVQFYQEDEFFHFSKGKQEFLSITNIQKYYAKLVPNEIHEFIAEIPFHMVLSVSPDLLLKKLFETRKIDFDFNYYNKQQNPGTINKPSSKKPLIYNLFGNIEDKGSVVFTYNDLFEYITNISGKSDMPQEIQSQIQNSSVILFLGFNFRKWYFKLLLRLLKIKEGTQKLKPAGKEGISDEIRNFYSAEFEIEFLKTYTTSEIIHKIHERFREKNKLRAAGDYRKSKPEIFLSYAWGKPGESDSEDIANLIYPTLIEKGYNVIRDKVDLAYKGNIKEFMQTIGTGKYVIVIISDKYLKSENCMFEILEMKKSGSIKDRIFPIVLRDANVYVETNRIDYINYWDKLVKELNDKINTIENKMGIGQVIEKLNQYNDIRRVFDEITAMLQNMNALTPEMHEGGNFKALMDALDKAMQADQSK